MIKDIRYIIKRIIVGVGIALVLGFLRGGLISNVHALEISNYGIGNTETVINNTTTYFQKDISGNPWSVYSGMSGYVNGSFAIQKVNGTATSINVFPIQVYVRTNTPYTDYVCNIGTAMEGNSTFNGGTFTYRCPIKMGSAGVTALIFHFQNIQTNFPSDYRLSIGSGMSFEIIEDSEVNVDLSGATNAINNQITNDNSNTQSIINNNNSNTDRIVESQEDINDSLNNDNVTESNSTINGFFSNFDTGSTGSLTDIISLPLDFLQSLNSTCQPLVLPLPYLNTNLTVPCISSYLATFVPSSLINLIKLLVNGFLCYRILSSLIIYINELKDPNNNDLEVMDL